MLSSSDNDILCRVGPGTLMGDLMREYWIPALMPSELATPDSPPMRTLVWTWFGARRTSTWAWCT